MALDLVEPPQLLRDRAREFTLGRRAPALLRTSNQRHFRASAGWCCFELIIEWIGMARKWDPLLYFYKCNSIYVTLYMLLYTRACLGRGEVRPEDGMVEVPCATACRDYFGLEPWSSLRSATWVVKQRLPPPLNLIAGWRAMRAAMSFLAVASSCFSSAML
jgi:hypothetical protein